MADVNVNSLSVLVKRAREAKRLIDQALDVTRQAYEAAGRVFMDSARVGETIATTIDSVDVLCAQAANLIAKAKTDLVWSNFQMTMRKGYPWHFGWAVFAADAAGGKMTVYDKTGAQISMSWLAAGDKVLLSRSTSLSTTDNNRVFTVASVTVGLVVFTVNFTTTPATANDEAVQITKVSDSA